MGVCVCVCVLFLFSVLVCFLPDQKKKKKASAQEVAGREASREFFLSFVCEFSFHFRPEKRRARDFIFAGILSSGSLSLSLSLSLSFRVKDRCMIPKHQGKSEEDMSVKCATGLLQGHPFSRSLSQRWELARTPADWSVAKEGSINDNDMTGSAVGSVIHLNGEELETNFGTGVGGSTLEMSRKDSLSFSARNTGRNNDPRAPLPPATAPAALLDSSIVFEITEEEQGKSIDDVWKNIQRSNSRSVDDDNMQQQGLVAGARPTIQCPQPC